MAKIESLLGDGVLKEMQSYETAIKGAAIEAAKLAELTKALDKQLNSQKATQTNLNTANTEADNLNKQLSSTKDKLKSLDTEQARLLETEKQKLSERNKELKLTVALEKENLGTREKLKLRNKELRGELDKLDLSRKAGRKRLKEINSELGKNEKQLTKTSDAYSKQKRGIGGYSQAIQGVIGKIFIFIGVIKAVTDIFARSQKIVDAVTVAWAKLTAAVNVIIDRLLIVGEGLLAIIKGNFSEGFDKIKGSMSGLGDEISREVKLAGDLEQKLIDLKKEVGAFVVQQALANRTIAANLLLSADQNISLEERIKALKLAKDTQDGLTKSLQEQKLGFIANELALLDNSDALKRVNDIIKNGNELKIEELGLSTSNQEDLDRVNLLVAEYIGLQTEADSRNRRVASQLSGLIKQQKALAKEEKTRLEYAAEFNDILDADADEELERIDKETQAVIDKEKVKLSSLAALNKQYNDYVLELDKAANEARIEEINKVLDQGLALFEKNTLAYKAIALAKIAIDTGQAISGLVANSETNPANAVTFGGAGILQYASGIIRILGNVIQAKKLVTGAKFAEGGTVSDNMVIQWGEKGRELFLTPGGEVGLSPGSSSLAFAEKGTKIIKNSETEKILAGIKTNADSRVVDAIESGNIKIVKAIKQSNKRTITQRGNKITEREGSYYKNYLNAKILN